MKRCITVKVCGDTGILSVRIPVLYRIVYSVICFAMEGI